ncbi:MAG TPA: response regulator [Burkholderiales bacterium]|nr:response regulator [Burkholderiales bacterium]
MLRKSNVLVVDDKRANFIALEAVLGEEHNVIFAASGPEAIALCEARSDIDVVLMDVQMPVMDGFAAAAQIKRIRGCEDLPIIFITAVYKEDPHIKQGYAAGGIDYFGKPFDPDILRMKVALYASFRQKADILRQRERHVRESEELLRVGRKLSAVLESLPVGVLIADAQGRICQTTDEVSAILKSVEPARWDSYGEILGWWDAGGRVLKDRHGPLARALYLGEVSHSETVSIRCFDGSTKTILASASPLRGLDGSIVGAVILLQDLTETRKIEEDLERRVTSLVSIGVELEESARR